MTARSSELARGEQGGGDATAARGSWNAGAGAVVAGSTAGDCGGRSGGARWQGRRRWRSLLPPLLSSVPVSFFCFLFSGFCFLGFDGLMEDEGN